MNYRGFWKTSRSVVSAQRYSSDCKKPYSHHPRLACNTSSAILPLSSSSSSSSPRRRRHSACDGIQESDVGITAVQTGDFAARAERRSIRRRWTWICKNQRRLKKSCRMAWILQLRDDDVPTEPLRSFASSIFSQT